MATLRQHADIIKILRFHHADSYAENKVIRSLLVTATFIHTFFVNLQDVKTALDFAQEADDVKEALLSYRFSSEVRRRDKQEMERERERERERVCVCVRE